MNHQDILNSGQRVLRTEGKALATFAEALDDKFAQAVETLMTCTGRVIVTGMGKSGHIARKMAATFASTGTPAYFVHPGEASHGDLGMIAKADVVLALSNSGEAPELSDLIHYTRRFAIPLIAVTSRPSSSLGSAADLVVALPLQPEACPVGMAPTTSTTMMLALGDAMAVAIMERRGFTADDFRNFHPGGKLGKTLLRVRDVMHAQTDMPLVGEDAAMREVLLVMTQKSLGCAGVTGADGALRGIITDGDLRRHMGGNLLDRKASEIMTSNPMTVGPMMLAGEALKLLNDKARTQLFVVDGGKPVGVLHVHDLLRAGIA